MNTSSDSNRRGSLSPRPLVSSTLHSVLRSAHFLTAGQVLRSYYRVCEINSSCTHGLLCQRWGLELKTRTPVAFLETPDSRSRPKKTQELTRLEIKDSWAIFIFCSWNICSNPLLSPSTKPPPVLTNATSKQTKQRLASLCLPPHHQSSWKVQVEQRLLKKTQLPGSLP